MPDHFLPDVCFSLLEVVEKREEPTPVCDLPKSSETVDLLRVCESRKLIEGVLWYEGGPTRTEPSYIVVGTSPGWLPYRNLGLRSLEDAITKRASDLRIKITESGRDALAERRIMNGQTLESPHTGLLGKDHKICKADARAAASFEWVCTKRPDLLPTKPGTRYAREQWQYIREHDCPAYKEWTAPAFETWKRQARRGLADPLKPKASSRTHRSHGKSIVQADQI